MEFPIVDLSVPVNTPTPEQFEHDFRKGELFNEGGKWKYTVWLDYRGLEWDTWDLWSNARQALHNSTDRGLSGVIFHTVPDGWRLVVVDPWGRYSHPIMVIGRGKHE